MGDGAFFGPIDQAEHACHFANLVHRAGEESPGLAVGGPALRVFGEHRGRVVLGVDGDGQELDVAAGGWRDQVFRYGGEICREARQTSGRGQRV